MQKEIKGILTKKQRQKLKEKKKSPSQRKALYIARKRVNQALADINFLLKCPENLNPKIDPELLLKIIESYLNQEAFTIPKEAWESDRLPPSLGEGRKRPPEGKKWAILGGCPRSDDGAPLKKNIWQRDSFNYKLLQIIHQNLREARMGTAKVQGVTADQILIITPEGNDMDLKGSTLYLPTLILEGKLSFLDAVKKIDPQGLAENTQNHMVLWRY
jgi:hypothetical protein